MAFMLSLADVENARSVAERYLSSSDFSFQFSLSKQIECSSLFDLKFLFFIIIFLIQI